jgi:hypothetical protein
MPRPTRVDVLFALPYDPDVRVRKTTTSLAQAGYDVRILAWDREVRHAQHEMDGAVTVERIQLRSSRGRGLIQALFFVVLGVRILARVRRRRPDVLHAVDLPMLLIAIVARALVARKARIVYDAFEIYAVMVAHRFGRPVLRVLEALERRLPRRADLVVTPGEARRAYFQARGIDAIVVPNWDRLPPPLPDRSAARAELSIPDEAFCIAYTGALLGSRDLESLVRFAERHPADLVVIAGSGDREAFVSEAAGRLPNLRFLGWRPDPGPIMAAADALYYALKTDHPYAAMAAPNNLYVAIANVVPLVHRPQGELGIVDRELDIGPRFEGDPELDAAVDTLRTDAARAGIRAGLAAVRSGYVWEEAVKPLLQRYPLPPTVG